MASLTALQAAAAPAHWLRHQPSPRSALGSQGIRVSPAGWPTPSSSEHRKLLRDGLRLTLWRACSPGCCPQTGGLWDVGVAAPG